MKNQDGSEIRSKPSTNFIILNEILLNIIGMFQGLHDLSIQQSTFVSGSDTFISLPTRHGKSIIYQLATPLMKELPKQSDELFSRSFACNVIGGFSSNCPDK